MICSGDESLGSDPLAFADSDGCVCSVGIRRLSAGSPRLQDYPDIAAERKVHAQSPLKEEVHQLPLITGLHTQVNTPTHTRLVNV